MTEFHPLLESKASLSMQTVGPTDRAASHFTLQGLLPKTRTLEVRDSAATIVV